MALFYSRIFSCHRSMYLPKSNPSVCNANASLKRYISFVKAKIRSWLWMAVVIFERQSLMPTWQWQPSVTDGRVSLSTVRFEMRDNWQRPTLASRRWGPIPSVDRRRRDSRAQPSPLVDFRSILAFGSMLIRMALSSRSGKYRAHRSAGAVDLRPARTVGQQPALMALQEVATGRAEPMHMAPQKVRMGLRAVCVGLRRPAPTAVRTDRQVEPTDRQAEPTEPPTRPLTIEPHRYRRLGRDRIIPRPREARFLHGVPIQRMDRAATARNSLASSSEFASYLHHLCL